MVFGYYSCQNLEYLSKHYDANKSLLCLPSKELLTNNNFLLSRIWLHPTRESLYYALLLLHKNIQTKRVCSIINTIVKLQNQDSHGTNYAGWPKFLESTYFRSPGEYWKYDRNWIEFIGIGLLKILLNETYRTRLDSGLIKAITSSVNHAAIAIKQRNISPDYTNIYVIGMCLTLLVGKLLDDEDLYQHGSNRLDEIYINAINCDCFVEYNSPNYSLITLRTFYYLRAILSDRRYSHNKLLIKKVNELYNLAWREISNHFHAPTRQWAGPHSRSYSPLLKSKTIKFIKNITADSNATKTKNDSILLDKKPDDFQVPLNLRHFFLATDRPRTITNCIFSRIPPQILSTYLTPKFTIGTVNYSDLWSQRNSLIAYWRGLEETRYLRLRCLHNGQDFSAAQLFCVQDKGNILGAINFSTDIGKENPYISKSRIHRFGFLTYDLRIRFEFGSTSRIPNLTILKQSNSSLTFEVDSIYFNFSIPYGRFDFHKLKWSISRSKKTLNLDILLYSGWIKLINFSSLSLAIISFSLKMTNNLSTLKEELIDIEIINEMLTLSGKNLLLSVKLKPDLLKNLRESFLGIQYKK
ncbi:MAG: hypothetical protein QNJ55_00630 [Xenococcus sp. MO_188.B8]|nr:hypothetical protein [Xenococcus sp. MO_188.B8]